MDRDGVIGLLFDKEEETDGYTRWRYIGSAKGMDYTYMRVSDNGEGVFWAVSLDKRLSNGAKIHVGHSGKSPSPTEAMLACLDSLEQAVTMINGAINE